MKNEKGAVMLEGMIIVILTMFILIWLLALGFLNYQCGLLRSVTNDAAVKIGMTYNTPTADILMGFVEADELSSRQLYGSFNDAEMLSTPHGSRTMSPTAWIKPILLEPFRRST